MSNPEIPRWMDSQGTIHTPLNVAQISQLDYKLIQSLAEIILSITTVLDEKNPPPDIEEKLRRNMEDATDTLLHVLLPRVAQEEIAQRPEGEKLLFIGHWYSAHQQPPPPPSLAA